MEKITSASSYFMKTLLSALFYFLACTVIYAQRNNKLDSLENERIKNYKIIQELNQTIASTGRTKEMTLSEYQARKASLERHRRQIKIVQQQKEWFAEQIEDTQRIIEALEADELKERKLYQATIIEMSKLSNQPSAASLLGVEAINEVFQRRNALEQLERTRNERIKAINATAKKLSERKKQLANLEERHKALEHSLKSDIEYEAKLSKDLEVSYQELQKREKELLARLQNLERFNQIILSEIENISRKQVASSSKSAKNTDEAKTATKQDAAPNVANALKNDAPVNTITAPAGSTRTPVFAENKSLLPWPVDKFTFIAFRFGVHNYPGLSNVQVENMGIGIGTVRNEQVRSIFDGRVIVARQEPTTGGWIVIIQHDEYSSVYAGLQNVYVKPGSYVKGRTLLGTVGLNEDGYPVLQFQIWKRQQSLDPEEWLAKNTGY